MQRAAILIGVSKTGNLQRLQAVTTGVRAMEKWTLAQGMDRELVTVITDEAGPVEPRQIKQAVKALVDSTTVEQLIIYFAGHGVNIRYGEYWLLSDAPDDTQAAVNVEGSVVLARQCGIPHVVLISDACRTAAEGIQAQNVTGSEVFPNTGAGGPERAVDLFFACTLGNPALEIKDPVATANTYRAVYTDALASALIGQRQELLERVDSGAKAFSVVRLRPLKRHLQAEVVRFLANANVPLSTNQTPDARITSDDDVWIARHDVAPAVQPPPADAAAPPAPPSPAPATPPAAAPAPRGTARTAARPTASAARAAAPSDDSKPSRPSAPPPPARASRGPGTTRAPAGGRATAPRSVGSELPETLLTVSQKLLRDVLSGGADLILSAGAPQPALAARPAGRTRAAIRRTGRTAGGTARDAPEADMLIGSFVRGAAPFGPTHYETGCGFKVRGAQVIDAFSTSAQANVLDDAGELVRIDQMGIAPAVNVVLTFEQGTGVVLPAIGGFLTALTFEDDELVNVVYEPSDNSPRWGLMQDRLGELRRLRALIASSAKLGVFRLEREDALELARRMQFAKGIDPTMALYAAYAYHDLQRRENIQQMQAYLQDDLQVRLFDVTLLARGLDGKQAGATDRVFPFLPMLSQGWALLSAHRVRFPAALAGLERHLVPSLWSLFDTRGIDMVRAAMHAREVR